MKIQFSIDQRDCARRGENFDISVITKDLNLENLPHKRELLVKYLYFGPNPDVGRVVYFPDGANGLTAPLGLEGHVWDDLVQAKEATIDSLFEKLEELETHRGIKT